MKKGIMITFIICGILLVTGAVLMIVGWCNGAAAGFDIDLQHRKIVASGKEELYAGEKETGKFTELEILADASAIKITEGEDFKVVYEVRGSAPEIQNGNGKLTIAEKKKNRFVLNFGSTSNKKQKIEIQVPKGTELDKCRIDSDAGDIAIESQNIGDLSIDVDAGNIQISSSQLNSIDIDADAGNVELKDIKNGSLKGDIDYGNVEISDSELGDLDINTDAGNIEVTGSRIDNVKMDSSYGNIDLALIGEEADYSIKAKVDYGSLKLNGKNQHSKINKDGKSGKSINIEADAGDVNIDF